MTNAFHQHRVVTEHRYVVPCPEPWGGTWNDWANAQEWARQKAESLGVDTSFDDWSRLHVEDDQIVIVLIEKSS